MVEVRRAMSYGDKVNKDPDEARLHCKPIYAKVTFLCYGGTSGYLYSP